VATVCSCGYWTLFTGSVIGGLVFTVAAQFLSAVAIALAWAKLNGFDRPFLYPATFTVLAVMALAYSGIFLWLGYRKLVRLEVRTAGFGGGFAPRLAAKRKLPLAGLLVCRSNSAMLNVIRKELRLQKPIAQLTLLFVLCWILVVLLQWLRPDQNITYL